MNDPVRQRRAQAARLADTGKRIGYAGIAVATIAFIVALVAGLPGWAVTLTVTGLVVAAIFLPPAIVLGYGVAKAEREDPEQPG